MYQKLIGEQLLLYWKTRFPYKRKRG